MLSCESCVPSALLQDLADGAAAAICLSLRLLGFGIGSGRSGRRHSLGDITRLLLLLRLRLWLGGRVRRRQVAGGARARAARKAADRVGGQLHAGSRRTAVPGRTRSLLDSVIVQVYDGAAGSRHLDARARGQAAVRVVCGRHVVLGVALKHGKEEAGLHRLCHGSAQNAFPLRAYGRLWRTPVGSPASCHTHPLSTRTLVPVDSVEKLRDEALPLFWLPSKHAYLKNRCIGGCGSPSETSTKAASKSFLPTSHDQNRA